MSAFPSTSDASLEEFVVLVDDSGRPIGSALKRQVHSAHTPLHLAFSCYAVRPDGAVLITRRAASKLTWPGVWTNSCCGHPSPDEAIEDAVRRRLDEELGLYAEELSLLLPDFRYRAVMGNGVVENEICPVFLATVVGDPSPQAGEVDDFCWLDWPSLFDRVLDDQDFSPWARLQVAELDRQRLGPFAA